MRGSEFVWWVYGSGLKALMLDCLILGLTGCVGLDLGEVYFPVQCLGPGVLGVGSGALGAGRKLLFGSGVLGLEALNT